MSDGGSAGGSIPEIIVTAPRIGVLDGVAETIDWSEVASQATIGTTFGFLAGGAIGAAAGGIGTSLSEIESYEGIDLIDSFEIRDDMIVIPGLPGGYLSLH
ncbi:MAG: hypothetical protein U5Q16_07405 [Gammaproteobacteria bacterium]|nr:hypothetical protein [Gammaproteobacteria bacterium]